MMPSPRKRRSTLDILSGTASSYNTGSGSDRSGSVADGNISVPLSDGTLPPPRHQQKQLRKKSLPRYSGCPNMLCMHGPGPLQYPQLKEHDFHHHQRRRRQKSCFLQALVAISMLLFCLSVLLNNAAISSSLSLPLSKSLLYIRHERELMEEFLVAEPSAAFSASASAYRLKKVHKPMSISFHYLHTKNAATTIPALPNKNFDQQAKRALSGMDADYGGLHVSSLALAPSHTDDSEHPELQQSPPPRRRQIPTNAYDLYETERTATLEFLDAEEPNLGSKFRSDEDITGPVMCRRNNWRSKLFPVCNHFHESTLDRTLDSDSSSGSASGKGGRQQHSQLQEYIIEFRGHGYFRDSWLLQRPDTYGSNGITTTGQSNNNNNDSSHAFVWKSMRLKDYFDYGYDMMYQIHREAIIMERLTSSERIVDIYGHCGFSIFAENMKEDVTPGIVPGDGYMRQKDLNKLEKTDVHPMNNLTVIEKLDMALVMAESLADIHGYKGGVIAHGDVHPDQWLRSSTGQIKLNDFNNAEIFDYCEAGNRYCGIFRCFGGTFRSPEEFRCIRASEAMDTYSMGNNIYSLLTGLWPFYNFPEDDEETVQNLLIDQKVRPLVDPRYRTRSFIESKLVAIMEECWEWEPERRISIFDVVRQLGELKATLSSS